MSGLFVLCGLLWALGATDGASRAIAGGERTIEILIAGPEGARSRMDAAIRPLFTGASGIRWKTEEKVPVDGALPESVGGGAPQTSQIWIDVSNPLRLRVYLPAAQTEGATTVRTLARTGTDDRDSDERARHAVALIVKAAVSRIRRGPDDGAEAGDAVSGPPAETVARSAPPAEHEDDGLFVRIQAGFGKLTATADQGSREHAKLGPTISLAIGEALRPDLVVYGEALVHAIANSTDRDQYGTDAHLGRDLVMWGAGPGIAYYFRPWNVYTSLTVGLAKIAFPKKYTDYPLADTDWGYFGALSVGKEWWGGRAWGVGVAGQLATARSMRQTNRYQTGADKYEDIVSDMQATTFSLSLLVTHH